MLLNRPQQLAVSHGDGPALIIAGPGSGKTTVINQRVKTLINSGVSPDNILVITFSRAAAREMHRRFEYLAAGFLPVTYGTMHSVFLSILSKETGIKSSDIILDNDRYHILRKILMKTENSYDESDERVSALIDGIGRIKSGCAYASKDSAVIFKEYQRELRRLSRIDFDDIILLTRKLFSENRACLKRWKDKYRYILVDEFQDVNAVQYDVIKMLAGKDGNLFAVGDDDQSIYGFRGADPKIMLRFPQDFPGCRIITLSTNYRSGEEIVSAAGRLISNNKARYKKELHASRTSGPTPAIKRFGDAAKQTDFIINTMLRLKKEGLPYEEMAVLYRTMSFSAGLVSALKREGIPFRLEKPGRSPFSHWIFEDILSYMRILLGGRCRSDFLKILNRPQRYLRRELFFEETVDPRIVLTRAKNAYEYRRIKEFFEMIEKGKKLSPFPAIRFIRKNLGYDEYLAAYSDRIKKPHGELFLVADEIEDCAIGEKDIRRFIETTLSLRNDIPDRSDAGVRGEGVCISTIHRSKGLEYGAVFIPDAFEGHIPDKKALLPEEMEEERRLLYVAMTRAKSFVFISYAEKRRSKNTPPSRFLYELQDAADQSS